MDFNIEIMRQMTRHIKGSEEKNKQIMKGKTAGRKAQTRQEKDSNLEKLEKKDIGGTDVNNQGKRERG